MGTFEDALFKIRALCVSARGRVCAAKGALRGMEGVLNAFLAVDRAYGGIRCDVKLVGILEPGNGICVYRLVALCMFFLSVCRLFWNQTVTERVSLQSNR